MYRFTLLFILTICCNIVASSSNQAPQLGPLVTVEHGQLYQDDRPLRIGIVRVFPPSIVKKSSEYPRAVIEVVHQLLSTTGYHYKYVVDTQDTLIKALNADQLDIVFGIPQHDSVHPMLLYSMPYVDIPHYHESSSQSSHTYFVACALLEHYELIRQMNCKMFIQNSGNYLGYLQRKWLGVSIYLHDYFRIQSILNMLLIACIILAILLVMIFARVTFLSIDRRNRTIYLKALLNKFPVPVYILDKIDGRLEYAYVNDVAKSKQFAIREECDSDMLRQHKNRLKSACKEAIRTRKTVSFVDRRMPESPYTVYVSSCTFQGETRAIKTVVNTKELLVLKDIAEKNSKLKDEFLANISHEVRTPLNSILGFCQLLPELSGEEATDALAIVEKKSKQLHKLINDILLLSKFESSEIQINLSEIYNHEWLPNVIERLDDELDVPAKVPVHYVHHDYSKHVTIDKELAYIILSNLLQNAIKFTTNGAVHIGCAYMSDYLVYYIKDTGIGMTKEECTRIFNRFVKLNTFTQGTGLGLPIVLRVVEILHGHLGIYSIPGEGTICYFCYPLDNDYEQTFSNIQEPILMHLKDAVWIGTSPEGLQNLL